LFHAIFSINQIQIIFFRKTDIIIKAFVSESKFGGIQLVWENARFSPFEPHKVGGAGKANYSSFEVYSVISLKQYKRDFVCLSRMGWVEGYPAKTD